MPSSKKPKPNQQCHCGSGKKYKKCCKVADDTRNNVEDVSATNVNSANNASNVFSSAATATNNNSTNNITSNIFGGKELRFKIGDRVLANVNYMWLPGTIIDTHYREPWWPTDEIKPYQILIDGDDERYVHAPYDGDKVVQRYDASKDESRPNNNTSNKKKKGGKKLLREEARLAEKELEERVKAKKSAFISEKGTVVTNDEEFVRCGMIDANVLCQNDSGYLSDMFEMAGWDMLKLPANVNRDSILELLQSIFSCLPRLRKKVSTLDAEDVEMFMEEDMRELLPSLLRMCISPEQFTPDCDDSGDEYSCDSADDKSVVNPSDFIWDCISLLEALQSSEAEFRINGHMAKEMASILRICTSGGNDNAIWLAYETIDQLFAKADESAFFALVDEMQFPNPCRGHMARLAYSAIAGEPWAEFDTHGRKLCSAISAILVDPKTSEETNSGLFGVVLDILRNPDWAENVLSEMLDSLRHCQLHMELDVYEHGGLDTLLKTASETIADANGNEDKLFLLKDIFRNDGRGIPACYCHRHPTAVPKIVCDAESANEAKASTTSMLNDSIACIELEQYDKALEVTTKGIQAIETELTSGGGSLLFDDRDLNKKMHALRGRAQLKLGQYEDALHCFRISLGGDPCDKDMFAYGGASKMRCDACLDGIRALALLGHVDAANIWYSNLMKANADRSGEDLAMYMANAQAEASMIVSNVTTKAAASGTLIDSEPAREGISCHVRQCTWKSVGKLETEDGSFYTATYTVPRLFLTLVWVRGKLLIWDYRESKVVQWVQKPNSEYGHEELIHTSDNSSIFVLYSNSGCPFIILLDNVKGMRQGGTCTAEKAMFATLAVAEDHQSLVGEQTLMDWNTNVASLMHKYGKISNSASAQIAGTKSWNMAVVRDSASMEVLIFTGDKTIAPGTRFGPYAFLEDKASFVLKGGGRAHLRRIYELLFVENGKADILVTSSGDKSIKIWDINARCCQHTIRGFREIVQTLACTSTLVFGAAMRSYSSRGVEDAKERENSTYGSHCVNVWDIESGHHKATLRSKSGRTVESLVTIPQQSILVSGHSYGEVHVWRYDEFGHVHGIKAISPEFSRGLSFHLHQSYFVVMSMTHLVMLGNPAQIDGDSAEGESDLPIVGQHLNCGNCGLWKLESSSSCSRCRQVSFCDKACLKEAWPKHKKSCRKRM